jgi:hypothetical protein
MKEIKDSPSFELDVGRRSSEVLRVGASRSRDAPQAPSNNGHYFSLIRARDMPQRSYLFVSHRVTTYAIDIPQLRSRTQVVEYLGQEKTERS